MSRANPSVYLAGPITGLSYTGATDWRAYAKEWLEKVGITAFSPLRAKNYLAKEQSLDGSPGAYQSVHPLSSPKGIVTRDCWDVRTADVILMNLLGAERVSVGTMIELGWASAWLVPVVLVIEGAPVTQGDNLSELPDETRANPHHHAMVDQIANYIVPTLDNALHIIEALVKP